MQFFATALLFAATVVALPQPGSGDGNTGGDSGNSNVKFPINSNNKYTLEQAQNKCGNDAKVSCCNKATYTHDVTSYAKGPLAGVLQNALGGGPGGDGLGLFGQCNDISANVPVLNIVGGGIDQLVEQKCKQNIACCQDTKSEANDDVVGVAIPCVALGSLI